jgi:hypothetical protein
MTNEELKHAANVMYAAHAGGVEIQCRAGGRSEWVTTPIDILVWNWQTCDYRIKPTKTLRPWTHEEVPVGAQTRVQQFPHERTMIVGVTSTGVLLAQDNGSYPFGDLLKFREHSTDSGKTWKPCGIEVEG